MKVAISTDGDIVSAHFGRCPSFTIVDVENGAVKSCEEIGNPGHSPGFIPEFLKSKNVECIIAGGMGARASMLFNEFGIKTMVGVTGKIEDVIKQFTEGNLKSGDSLCNPGAGKGYGVDKKICDHGNEKYCEH